MLSSKQSPITNALEDVSPDSVLDAQTPRRRLVGAARAALRPERSERPEGREMDASTGASTGASWMSPAKCSLRGHAVHSAHCLRNFYFFCPRPWVEKSAHVDSKWWPARVFSEMYS